MALIVLPLVLERFMVRRWRKSIPVRVHVHGTRGKSSTVRECTRLLREQGLSVLAKTTGDAPEYILPDGSVEPVRRIGPARIQEHVALLRKAARLGVDAVVAEGMALLPETVWQSENILKATHGVITNVRPDHGESMGDGRDGVARTLGLMIPRGSAFITAAEEGAERLAAVAESRNTSVRVIDYPSSRWQPACLADAVVHSVFAARPASAHCTDNAANAGPAPSTFFYQGKPFRFLDLLSANDVESSMLLCRDCPRDPNWLRVALLATRADRPLRTKAFLDWLVGEKDFDLIVPQGGHAGYVWLKAWRDHRLVVVNPWMAPCWVMGKLSLRSAQHGGMGVELVGLGNSHGTGERWRAMLGGDSLHAR